MGGHLGARIAQIIPTLLLVSVLVFSLQQLMPGDPAMVMAVLNDYLSRMTDVIIAHGGTVNEFIGDAVFAIFGAPLPHPDHAERAAAAALAMQGAMAEINAGLAVLENLAGDELRPSFTSALLSGPGKANMPIYRLIVKPMPQSSDAP